MFQNLSGEYQEEAFEESPEEKKKWFSKEVVKQIFTKQNLLLYILSFMISTVGFRSNGPFWDCYFSKFM